MRRKYNLANLVESYIYGFFSSLVICYLITLI